MAKNLFDLDTSTGLYEGWVKTGQARIEVFQYPGTDARTLALILPYVTEDGKSYEDKFSIGDPSKWQIVQGKVDAVHTVNPDKGFHQNSGVGRTIQDLSANPQFIEFANANYPTIGLNIFSNQEFFMERPQVMKDGKPELNAKGMPKTELTLTNWRPAGQITHVVNVQAQGGSVPAPMPQPVAAPQAQAISPEVASLIAGAVVAGKVKPAEILGWAMTQPGGALQLGGIQQALANVVWLSSPERGWVYDAVNQVFAAK